LIKWQLNDQVIKLLRTTSKLHYSTAFGDLDHTAAIWYSPSWRNFILWSTWL